MSRKDVDVLTAIGILVVAALVAGLFFAWRTTTDDAPGQAGARSAAETVPPPTTSPLTGNRSAESQPRPASPPAPTAIPETPTPPAPGRSTADPADQSPAPALLLSPVEVEPDAKALGAAVVHQLTNYQADVSFQDLAAGLVSDRLEQAALLLAASPVLHSDSASQGVVEYAQLGGLTISQVSIMVLVRQQIQEATGPERVETRTVDVRLKRSAPDSPWEFERLASAGGEPVPRPENLSPAAVAVLDDPRITIADSARWDIYSGHTQDSMLTLMSSMAEVSPYAAVVLHTGHPINVFQTNRLSNHSVGRAIDIYRVGDQNVIDGRDQGSAVWNFALALTQRADIVEFGTPWPLDDTPWTFTNLVHQDHLHVAAF